MEKTTMKKNIMFAVLAVATISMAACGKKDSSSTDIPSPAGQEEVIGMPNPMVEISDDAEFEKQLGINIDVSPIPGEFSSMYIIGKNLADVRFSVPDLDDQPVSCCLRATKDESVKENPATALAGMYYDFDTPVTIDYDKFSINTYSYRDKVENVTIYSWNYDGTYCALTIQGELSQMQISEILDGCMAALNMSPF